MTVKKLIELLSRLDPDSQIDISGDEEGNTFGDIDENIAKQWSKKTNKYAYILYPTNTETPEERYD